MSALRVPGCVPVSALPARECDRVSERPVLVSGLESALPARECDRVLEPPVLVSGPESALLVWV